MKCADKKCADPVLARRWVDDERGQIDRWLAENAPTVTAQMEPVLTRKPRAKTVASKLSGAVAHQLALAKKRGHNKQNFLEV